jgi:hypothetical protein
MQALGSHYGAFPAHDGLWESATATAHSLPARLAVEHCVHEARGLDVLPHTIQRLRAAGDTISADILEGVVYPEEVTHCAAGVRWLRHLYEVACPGATSTRSHRLDSSKAVPAARRDMDGASIDRLSQGASQHELLGSVDGSGGKVSVDRGTTGAQQRPSLGHPCCQGQEEPSQRLGNSAMHEKSSQRIPNDSCSSGSASCHQPERDSCGCQVDDGGVCVRCQKDQQSCSSARSAEMPDSRQSVQTNGVTAGRTQSELSPCHRHASSSGSPAESEADWINAARAHESVQAWFHSLVRQHFKGLTKPPFNVDARAKAGFDETWYLPLSS